VVFFLGRFYETESIQGLTQGKKRWERERERERERESVCVPVSVHMRVCVVACVCICEHAHTHVHVSVSVRVWVCLWACVHVSLLVHVCECVPVSTSVCLWARVCWGARALLPTMGWHKLRSACLWRLGYRSTRDFKKDQLEVRWRRCSEWGERGVKMMVKKTQQWRKPVAVEFCLFWLFL
jgi:hypothetical protein